MTIPVTTALDQTRDFTKEAAATIISVKPYLYTIGIGTAVLIGAMLLIYILYKCIMAVRRARIPSPADLEMRLHKHMYAPIVRPSRISRMYPWPTS